MSTKTRKSNGEGTIYFSKKDGCWRAEITWFDSGGVRRRKCWGAKKQSEVKAKLNEFKKQLLKNGKSMTNKVQTYPLKCIGIGLHLFFNISVVIV